MSALSALCLDWMAEMGPLFMDRTGVLLGIEAGMVNEILSNDPIYEIRVTFGQCSNRFRTYSVLYLIIEVLRRVGLGL